MKQNRGGSDSESLAEARDRAPAHSRLMHQRWENLLFLHWGVPAGLIQPTLPAGLSVDTFQGTAYLAISPFFMRGVRPIGMPALPMLSDFQEMNVRTYVRGADGMPGIWFYSLDCNLALAAIGARLWTGLPYFYASMEARYNGHIDFRSTRTGMHDRARYVYRAAGPARKTEPGTFEFFALERYFLYSRRPGSEELRRGQVKHQSYKYRDVEVTRFSTMPMAMAGFTGMRDPGHACLVDGFDVEVYATEPVPNNSSSNGHR